MRARIVIEVSFKDDVPRGEAVIRAQDIANECLDQVRGYARAVNGAELRLSRVEAEPEDPTSDAPTAGERLMPGCECGAARSGNFERCRCD